jgi:hypothetical protein
MDRQHAARQPSADSTLVRALRRRIGASLRAAYGRPEGEPIPEEHVDLVLKLRQRERELARAQ